MRERQRWGERKGEEKRRKNVKFRFIHHMVFFTDDIKDNPFLI